MVEAWRTYRLGTLSGLFVVLGIVTPLATRYLPELLRAFGPTDLEIGLEDTGLPEVVDGLLGNLVRFGGAAAVLLAMGAIAGERERGTLSFVLAKPVGRAAFLWAKVVALGMQLGLAIGLAVVAAWLYSNLLFERPPIVAWAQLAILAWLSAMVYGSITLLGSVVVRTPLAAAALGLAAIAAVAILSSVATLSPWLPGGLVDVARSVALDEISPDLDPPRTIAVSLGFIAVSLALAWWRFRRQDV
jgi:ABC-2 type transport system permease protein